MSDLVLHAGGSVTMTHHVTGTYFMCNDWHDGVGNHTQTWAQDPFAKDNNSHRWFLRQNADGTVRIESYANHRCLTAGANPPDTVTLRERTDSLNQHWRLVSHAERGNDFYLVSVVHPRYALAIADHLQGNDRLVGLTRMWGGPNLSQLWRIYPSSEDQG
ncbi:RICIN domain-containing protein [Streptomyces swartbergensis]|uniref:RICIN domain-containing protein n=1 Tax=Streptomyces swartbergensis TaxID=487165 RepID=UPI003803DF00